MTTVALVSGIAMVFAVDAVIGWWAGNRGGKGRPVVLAMPRSRRRQRWTASCGT